MKNQNPTLMDRLFSRSTDDTAPDQLENKVKLLAAACDCDVEAMLRMLVMLGLRQYSGYSPRGL